jgi:hypothetical protein
MTASKPSCAFQAAPASEEDSDCDGGEQESECVRGGQDRRDCVALCLLTFRF